MIAVGTGGTISGIGALPEGAEAGHDRRRRRPRGLDLHGGEEDMHPYLVEGVGEDFWPQTFDRTSSTSG